MAVLVERKYIVTKTLLTLCIAALLATGCASPAGNKAIIRHWIEQGINQGNLAMADKLFAANFVAHTPQGDVQGVPEGPKQAVVTLRNAFPDIRFTISDQIAEGDKVATRWTASGTHEREFMGAAPTGKRITFSAIYVYRLARGKIVEVWTMSDTWGLLQQLGFTLSPSPGGG
jgi:steroid delta-isomerase-like uncharacterized protein